MTLLTCIVTTTLLLAAQHPAMPAGMSHEDHLKQMARDDALKERGADAMGFDQNATTHHFRLTVSGGSIEVTVKNPADEVVVAAVRDHLRSIANDFTHGNFDKPFATHGEVPPGVAVMQKSAQAISYRFEELPGGGVVRITAADAGTLDAVHAFLRYQIVEHNTGDPLQAKD